MFIQLSRDVNGQFNPVAAGILIGLHPALLALLMDSVWMQRIQPPLPPANAQRPLPVNPRRIAGAPGGLALPFPIPVPLVICHLIYTYMIENTRIFEIFQRVLHEYLHGERLGIPQIGSQSWLRATEELFFKETPHFLAHSVTSHIRADVRSSRRNAYYRMFGMDLNHGTGQNAQYPYEKAQAANTDFVTNFELFLKEVWRGILNANNQNGPNTTDDAAIANHARRLGEVLRTRRQSGNLLREEFYYVATMSWFHFTLSFDSPILIDMGVRATTPADRLRIIGERVGFPAHPRADSFFQIAEPLSNILLAIEDGLFDYVQDAQNLYLPGAFVAEMQQIITHWSIATGRSIKSADVSPVSRVSAA